MAVRRPAGHAGGVKFDDSDRADPSQVEDRRGSRFPGGRAGAGVGGLGLVGGVIYLVLRVMADNGSPTAGQLTRAIEQAQQNPGAGTEPGAEVQPSNLSGSCRGVDARNDPAKFIVCVENNVQAFWRARAAGLGRAELRAGEAGAVHRGDAAGLRHRQRGRPARSTVRATASVYLDLGFFRELTQRFGARGGDFAQAYVVAHEYGHHIQDLLGIERRVRALQAQNPSQRQRAVGAARAAGRLLRRRVGPRRLRQGHGRRAARSRRRSTPPPRSATTGSRRQSRGSVTPETFTHGSAAERQHWFTAGMRSGRSDRLRHVRADPPLRPLRTSIV